MAETTATPEPSPLPGPSERIRTWCLVVLTVCVASHTLAQLKSILTPLLIALFLFLMIKPLAEALAMRRLPRSLAYSVLSLLAVLVIFLLSELVITNLRAFEAELPEYRERLGTALDTLARLTGHANAEGRFDWEQYTLGDFFNTSREQLLHFAVESTLTLVETSLMVLFYLCFLFLEAYNLPRRIRGQFEPGAADRWLRVGSTIYDGIKRYLIFKTGINTGLALSTGLLGFLFGVDFWALWAILLFFGNYITYIGSIVGLVPPIALACLQLHPTAAAAFTALLILNRLLWIDYAEIRWSGKQLNISPLVLLLSLAVFGWLWGVVGMLLAVPIVTAAKIVLSNFESSRYLAVLISEE